MNLTLRDKKHLWHPLTQHKLTPNHLAITRTKDSLLYDENGKSYIDAIASWYTCMYGHCNPYIIEKIKEQLCELDQVVFSGFTHTVAIEMSEKLMKILPKNQQKIFFSDNGSTSVEVALKMALQYFFNQGKKKYKIIAFEEAFHGDTFGAMSVSGLSVYNGAFTNFFIEVIRIALPNEDNFEKVKNDFCKLLEKQDVAAFIFEPLVQGAAGMKIYNANHLNELIFISQKYNVLTIADEVMTGFGKTGKHFASLYLKHYPDIICLSKSLTAGVVPMGLTCCTQNIFDAFYDDNLSKGLFHGHTYSANPLACKASLAGMELLLSDEIQAAIKNLSKKHIVFSKKIKDHRKVKNIRSLGVIFAFELNISMDRYSNLQNQLSKFFMQKGIFLRPLGNTIYILPPFTILEEELQQIYNTIEAVLDTNFLEQ